MKSPLIILSKVVWKEHIKQLIWSVVAYGCVMSVLSLMKFQNQQNMLDSFAGMFLIMLTWVSLLITIGFTRNHFGLKLFCFPLQLFNYPVSSWKIGSLFYWCALVIILIPVLLLGGCTRLLGASIPDPDGIIMAVCFVLFGLSFSLKLPFILLSLASLGSYYYWYFDWVPISGDLHLYLLKGLVTLGFLLWMNILFVGSTFYQRHNFNLKEWFRHKLHRNNSHTQKAVSSIYPRIPKESPLQTLTWMEGVRFAQNLWGMVVLLAVTPIIAFVSHNLQWVDFYYSWLGCLIIAIVMIKTGNPMNKNKAQHASRLFLPLSDYKIGQAEYRGLYISIVFESMVGLYVIGILTHFDILRPTYFDNIQGPEKTVFLISIPLIIVAGLSIRYLLSLFIEMAKQYPKPFNKIVIGTVLFLMLFPMGFIIPNIHALFSHIKRPDTITSFFGGALWIVNLLFVFIVMGAYLWSLKESWRLNITNQTQLHKAIGIFTGGLLLGLVIFGLVNGISYLLISNLLVGLSIILTPIQLLPIMVHKKRHQ